MQNDSYRKNLIAKVHIGKSQLKMDEETYRTFLMNAVNKTSCKAMSNTELNQVLDLMAQRGAKVRSNFWGNRQVQLKRKSRTLPKSPHYLLSIILHRNMLTRLAKKPLVLNLLTGLLCGN